MGGDKALTNAAKADQTPTALPSSFPENICPIALRLLGKSNAAPSPCTNLAPISDAKFHASEQKIVPTQNSAIPNRSIRRRPIRSPIAPPSIDKVAKGNK